MLFTNRIEKPLQSFTVLELNEDASESEVIQQYKRLMIKHHPDKGGSHDKFIEITDAKNKCLAYIQQ